MPLILNIETSTPVCSVCLSRNGEVVDIREDRQGNSHARVLTVFIEQLITDNKLSYTQLEAVAISAGPGSYTGLRIGASVAKGLCYALQKPLIAISTLQAMAKGMSTHTTDSMALFMPVLDARRMDVYTALYDILAHQVTPPVAVTLDEHFERLIVAYGRRIYIGGNAMIKCQQILKSTQFEFLAGIDCSSRFVGILAEEKFRAGKFENLAYFQPDYLKEFEGKKNM